jgi:Xaa-Pro dipeptidase
MNRKVPEAELDQRLKKFREEMDKREPEWELALIISKINQYYFTGTMQEGLLFIARDDEPVFYVRRSYERAVDESLFANIQPMETYRDAAAAIGKLASTVYLETEIVPLAMFERLRKYFGFTAFKSLEPCIMSIRSIKSRYELDLMINAGEMHRKVIEERVPALLKEGMTEGDLTAGIFTALQQEGHHGVARFGMFDTEVLLGHITFGISSLNPTYFNGPGGNYSASPAVPMMGSDEHRLSKGDLVFIDTGCGCQGYHSDKTMTYMFGRPLPQYAVQYHQKCLDVQERIAEMLRPGEIPSNIYNTIMNSLDDDFLQNFMGFRNRKVKFLGHGIGLQVDELPVLAKGFDEPICEGMAFAVEPKFGVEGIGMVGIENTFLVTPEGGRCITGNHPGLLLVE